ncbi:hypothetical protein [Ferrovibrio sp.]|uniref:hypothetical protein n=1 Tax=Ferrovibrio sp. TaxID=1917215 RepID=UPI00311FB292
MGWFDSVTDFFTGGSGGGTAGLILGAAQLGSTLINASANKDAAKTYAAGQTAAADAIREGNAAAQKRYDDIAAQTAGANSYLRSIYANPEGLSPLQQQERDELRRTTANRLATSGLRGAGRAQVAAFRATDSDFTNRAISDNFRRADAAAAQQSGQGYSAASQAAGLDAATGRAVGTAAANSAEADANAGLATASSNTRALTDLAGFIASETKGRRSRQQAAREDDQQGDQ